MPSRERVAALVAMVEQEKYVEAIEEFYAENAAMQENGAPPRVGREKLIEGERKMLAAHKKARTLPGSSFLLDGDRIVEERFFYDPAQLSARLASPATASPA